jgi:uncharacterized repeat protein (TIGR03803 family)
MRLRSLAKNHLATGVAGALLSACAALQVPVTPTSPSADRATIGNERVIYSFTGGADGGDPATALTLARSGNSYDLYGTTVLGGSSACGTVFRLMPLGSPSWQEQVVYSFGCSADGKNPYGGVTFDARGNLYGTTVSGGSGGSCGSSGCGVVFKLSSKSETVLHSFTGGNDGFGPGGPVVFDSAGDIFGTTPDGGKDAQGVIYELSRSGRSWHERVVHAFTGGKGGATGSLGALLVDASNSLYGVTELAGAHGAGTVFRLSRINGRLRRFMRFAASPTRALRMADSSPLLRATFTARPITAGRTV